jgi:hypothetical protein
MLGVNFSTVYEGKFIFYQFVGSCFMIFGEVMSGACAGTGVCSAQATATRGNSVVFEYSPSTTPNRITMRFNMSALTANPGNDPCNQVCKFRNAAAGTTPYNFSSQFNLSSNVIFNCLGLPVGSVIPAGAASESTVAIDGDIVTATFTMVGS